MKFLELVKMMDTKLYEFLKDDGYIDPLSAYTIINHRWPHLLHRWNGIN